MKVLVLTALSLILMLALGACMRQGVKEDEVAMTIEEEATPMAEGNVAGMVSSTLVPPVNSPLPDNPNLALTFDTENLREIYLAGGCFWGVEAYMARIYGVYDVTSGYANGETDNPTYYDVVGGSGHAETVHVRYDPSYVELETLLDMFFEVVDPTSLNQQGNDKGISYRSGIYYTDESDLPVIEAVIKTLAMTYDDPIVVEVEPLQHYYIAEEYHQDYLEKNPNGYCHIEFDAIEAQEVSEEMKYQVPDDETLKEMLTDIQYEVTQNEGTERAFDNEYWDHKEEGIYVDVVTGEPLFSSVAKYDSGSGWPSFWAPIEETFITTDEDNSLYMPRTEIRSAYGDSHLGHVFDDGPQDMTGLRYCVNSAALRFVAYEDMDAEGYGDYKKYVRAE